MTSTIEWHKTSERPPVEEGDYLVICETCGYRQINMAVYMGEIWHGQPTGEVNPVQWAELPWPEEE